MKIGSVITSLLISAVCAPCGIAQMRDAATGADLAKQYEKARLGNPLKSFKEKQTKGPDPTITNRPVDILKSSDFLSFQGYATLIPKRAIIITPKRLKDRIRLVPGSQIITWKEFSQRNPGWIRTHEVTRAQAEGNEPFSEEVTENLAKSSSIVVATYKNGPISVLPQKEPEPELDPEAKDKDGKKDEPKP